jgi:hypothetical protein
MRVFQKVLELPGGACFVDTSHGSTQRYRQTLEKASKYQENPHPVPNPVRNRVPEPSYGGKSGSYALLYEEQHHQSCQEG